MPKALDQTKYLARAPFIDIGRARDTVALLAGMGRGGTTWGGNVINYAGRYRILFEPFHPEQGRVSRGFVRPQYIRPGEIRHPLAAAARRILAGKPRSRWVDLDNAEAFYRQRIIKEIQANLMLGWLHALRPEIPIVLMVRHPLQIAASWRALGWADAVPGETRGFERVARNEELLADYPVIKNALREIDRSDPLDRVIFQWGVYHFVPVQQLGRGFHTLYYERLLTEPRRETERLFRHLGQPFDWEAVRGVLGVESSTNFLKRGVAGRPKAAFDEWKTKFTPEEIRRANDLLGVFGLDQVYDEDGRPMRDDLVDAHR